MPTQPSPTATSSTFQVGTYSSLIDMFTSTFDLNDGVTTTIMWNTLKLLQPEKAFVRSFNLRAPGERLTRFQYKNRHIQVSVSLRGASVQAILNTCHSLIAAIENPPYRLRLALPNATQYTYATVVAVTHNIPTDPQTLLAKALPNVQIDFECLPGLLGDRVTLQNLVVNPGFEAPSGPSVLAFYDSFATANAYSVQAGATPLVSANVYTIPAGSRVAFGSPAWGALQTWQVRFQFISGAVPDFFLHYTDASNYLDCFISSTGIALRHLVAGASHTLTSGSFAALTANNWYWLLLTQYPAQAANAPYVQATLYNDSAGAIGAAVSGSAIGPVATFDGSTALTGRPQISVTGNSLPIGGNFANVHAVSLFGPGAWMNSGTSGTGSASGAWEQTTANTYPSGPVTSYGAARIDGAPAGTLNAYWITYSGGAPAGTNATPAKQNQVFGLAAQVKSSGVGVACAQALQVTEWDASGNSVHATTTVASVTGPQAAYTALSGTYTVVSASCAYIGITLLVLDTNAGASANGTVWFDNVQVWNQTTTGQTSMPYCELRFPQSPAQLLVSGLLGDLPAPAFVALGAYLASWPAGGTLALLLGRRAITHPQVQLIRWPLQPFVANANIALDAGSYGGYYTKSPAASTSAQANMIYVWPNPSACLGTYHLVERVQTSQLAGNLGNVSARLAAFEGVAVGIGNQANFFNGYVAGQLAASATWALVDHGTLFVPIFTAASLGDLSQQYESCYGQWQDTTSGGSTFSFGVPWLLPVDADVLGATLINPTNGGGALTAFWLWAYSDALGQGNGSSFAWGFSGETTALPVPAHSIGGPGTQTTGQPSINPSASPYLTLDPQAGTATGAAGVNQCAGSLVDQSGALLPLHCEIQYVPLYLYPR